MQLQIIYMHLIFWEEKYEEELNSQQNLLMKFMLSDYYSRSKNYRFSMDVDDRGDHSRRFFLSFLSESVYRMHKF
jgi:hypothetical protein